MNMLERAEGFFMGASTSLTDGLPCRAPGAGRSAWLERSEVPRPSIWSPDALSAEIVAPADGRVNAADCDADISSAWIADLPPRSCRRGGQTRRRMSTQAICRARWRRPRSEPHWAGAPAIQPHRKRSPNLSLRCGNDPATRRLSQCHRPTPAADQVPNLYRLGKPPRHAGFGFGGQSGSMGPWWGGACATIMGPPPRYFAAPTRAREQPSAIRRIDEIFRRAQ